MEPTTGDISELDLASTEQTGLFGSNMYDDDAENPWIGGLQHGLDDDAFQHAPFLSDVPSPGDKPRWRRAWW